MADDNTHKIPLYKYYDLNFNCERSTTLNNDELVKFSKGVHNNWESKRTYGNGKCVDVNGAMKNEIKDDQIKLIKEEVNRRLTEQVKKVAHQQTKKILSDINSLEIKKISLEKKVNELKKDIEDLRNYMRNEKEDLENMIEKYINTIYRYQNMEL